MKIRTARAEDIPQMLELWSRIDEFISAIGDNEEAVQAILAKNPDSCLAAWHEDTLAGTVLGTFDGWRGFIYHLAVHPDFRRQGWGQALLDTCWQILHDQGARRVNLYTYTSNTNAVEFYRHHGWQERVDLTMFSRD